MNDFGVTDYETLLARAEILLGDLQIAESWIAKPAIGLNGLRPVDLLASNEGIRVLNDFLLRLEYCVYT